MRNFIFFLVTIIIIIPPSSQTILKCDFNFGGLYLIGNVYRCITSESPLIYTEQSAQIDSIDGVHKENKSNNDVADFHANKGGISYFPKGLDKYFPNLVSITFQSCHLREIHQEDLKGFPDLVALQLNGNDIEVIEQGLFDFNPKLKRILFYEKLIHIDPNVFDNLPKLGYLSMNGLKCLYTNVINSREKVKAAVRIIKEKCVNSNFMSLEKKIKQLENESKILNYDDFNEKFVDFEMEFGNSVFLKFRPIRSIYKQLKYLNDNEPTTPMNSVIDSAAKKFDHIIETATKSLNIECPNNQLTQDLKNITSSFEDLKTSQCGLRNVLSDVKSSQDSLSSLFSDLSVSQDEIGTTVGDTKSITTNLEFKFGNFDKMLKEFQINAEFTLSDIDTKVKNLQTQNIEIKAEMKKSSNKLGEKVDNFVSKFSELEEKLYKIENELSNIRHRIEIKFEEKITKTEKRLAAKIESILDEKLGKIFEKKLMEY